MELTELKKQITQQCPVLTKFANIDGNWKLGAADMKKLFTDEEISAGLKEVVVESVLIKQWYETSGRTEEAFQTAANMYTGTDFEYALNKF